MVVVQHPTVLGIFLWSSLVSPELAWLPTDITIAPLLVSGHIRAPCPPTHTHIHHGSRVLGVLAW